MANARRSNFDLNKSVNLRDISLQGDDLRRQRSSGLRDIEFKRSTGLRDIGQAREEGLQAAVNNALQRGIFKSGIRKENQAEIERESGEAKSDLLTSTSNAEGDLRSRISIALDRLANRRRGTAGQQFVEADSGGGAGGFETAIAEFLAWIEGREREDFDTPDMHERWLGIPGFNPRKDD